jgi:hypothetical protein
MEPYGPNAKTIRDLAAQLAIFSELTTKRLEALQTRLYELEQHTRDLRRDVADISKHIEERERDLSWISKKFQGNGGPGYDEQLRRIWERLEILKDLPDLVKPLEAQRKTLLKFVWILISAVVAVGVGFYVNRPLKQEDVQRMRNTIQQLQQDQRDQENAMVENFRWLRKRLEAQEPLP